ncbi:MAG: acyl-CoA thioesterase [Nisaea sp.]|jgi:acyl-CoA thioester hydrolase|uniref:acyl-CoA thioesterase n=1 Tax=Nisaea sp. TaxID=2024842 RepID=UPI001B20BC7D|nr:thioesterase family protein [Nisaea sp.]MBO6562593.1 acyl-CoA thioesterase [Nisaea sp.]
MTDSLGGHGSLSQYAVTDELRARFHIPEEWSFAMPKLVEWRDCDGFAHVNHTAYLAWYESLRNIYFEVLGHPRHAMNVPGPVMKHLEIEYIRGLSYHAPVCVTGRTVSMRNTSMVMEYATWDEQGCCNWSTQLFVMIVNSTGKKAPISPELRQAITDLDHPEQS